MALRRSLFIALILAGCPGRDDLVINTSALPTGRIGEAYQATITAAGGAEEGYVWRATGLPDGLELAAQGTPSAVVSGTPAEAGTVDVTVDVTDVDGNQASGTVRIVIEGMQLPDKLEITTASLPDGSAGAPYQAAIAATGGSELGYTWSLSDGTLPAGLTLEEAGTPSTMLVGTPAATGAFPLTVQVRDSGGSTATKQLTLQIDEPTPLEIVTENLAPGQLAVPYSATITGQGGTGDYQWTVAGGNLPLGIALLGEGTPSTTLEGTPGETGVFDLTLAVEDGAGARVEQQLRLVISGDAIAIATLNLPVGVVGLAYSATVTAAGGTDSGYAWTVLQGNLPDGLTVAPAGTPSTVLSGTPTSTGSFTFTLQVADDAGGSASQAFTVEVLAPVSIETAVLPGGREGAAYSATVTATGAAGNYSWSIVQGSLPPGLMLAGGTPSAAISGTPTDWGTFSFMLRVDEPLGSFDERALTIELLPVPVEIVTNTLPTGTALAPYSAGIFTVNGSMMSYAWTSGALPPGLALDPSGTPSTTLSGTPPQPGTYTATITVTDGITGDSDSQRFTLEITAPPITIETTVLTPPRYGSPYTATITASGGSGTGFIWSVTDGTLPRGLTLGSNGTPSTTLSGFPIQEGPYDFTIRVQDSFGTVDTQQYSGSVTRDLVILTRGLPVVDGGTNYSTTIVAAGGTGTGYVWSISRGAAPSGLILGAGGTPGTTLAGLTNALGLHSFDVRVTDSNGTLAGTTFHLQVRAPQTSTLIVGDLFTNDETSVFINGITPGSTSPIQISPPGGTTMDANTTPANVQFSPDNSRAAFVGDFTTDGRNSLYVVDLVPAIGQPFDVSGAIVAGGNVQSFVWSPDSEQLLFRANKLDAAVFELFWVDMRGGVVVPAQRISGTMAAGGNLTAGGFSFAPDAAKVVYHADQDIDTVEELFLVDIEGPIPSAPERLNNPLVANGDTDDSVVFLPGGDGVLYLAEEQLNTVYGLHLADITGGGINARRRLNTRSAIVGRTVLSADGSRVLFVSDDDIVNSRELFMVDLTAPSPTAVKINPDFGSNTFDVQSAKWSPDGRRVLYTANQENGTQVELFVASAEGFEIGAPQRVNAPFTLTTSNVDFDPLDGYAWSPDGFMVAYRADATSDDVVELWIADVTVSPPAANRVTPVLPVFADVFDFLFSPDSNRIVYRADPAADGQEELFHASLAGATPAAPEQVNTMLPVGGDVSIQSPLRWSRNSQTIYFIADQTADNVFAAWGVSFAGGAPAAPFMIHGLLPANADVNVLNVQQP